MQTKAQKEAKLRYQKKLGQKLLLFYPKESDLWEFIQAKPNASGYIKSLIRKDMESGQ